ncbi:hypothetical protein [Marinobacterium litorale]|uniref:hypothetical protein n=1 Tax=Marinobacterium litorale TaxID=404770 RepID=UPI00041BF3CD|nr:hypothetical protein [Marinobacterium litorale]
MNKDVEKLQEYRERKANKDRWNLGDWRAEAHPTNRTQARNGQAVKPQEELYAIIRSLRIQLIISLGFNAVLVYQLLF